MEDPSPIEKEEIGIGTLNILDFALFERVDRDRFALHGAVPDWLRAILADTSVDYNSFALGTHFPFFEFFLLEAEEFWNANERSKVHSEIWTEMDTWGKEYYLQAYAVCIGGRKLIVFGPTDTLIEDKQPLIQKAREKTLDFEYLAKTQAALEKLLRFKDHFVTIVNHDLRSPLAMVSGFVKRMIANEALMAGLDTRNRNNFRLIDAQLAKIVDYNEKIYHWSNLELGNFQLNKNDVQLAELCNNTKNVFASKIESKNLTLKIDVPDDLHIEVDEVLFSQVLNNLIGNAIKFTPTGGTIAVRGYRDNQNTHVKVIDDGLGIKKETRSQIFREYMPEHTFGTEGESGTGLGLGICKKIVDAHGFSISFESEEKKGTEFTIII